MRAVMKRVGLVIAALLAGCGGSQPAPSSAPPAPPPAPEIHIAPEYVPPLASSAEEPDAGPPQLLSREAVQQVIRQWYPEVRGCYEREVRNQPNLRGKVVVRFMIGEEGKVLTVDMDSSEIDSPEVIDCVRKLFGLMEFPPPEKGMILITYPFEFEMEEKVVE